MCAGLQPAEVQLYILTPFVEQNGIESTSKHSHFFLDSMASDPASDSSGSLTTSTSLTYNQYEPRLWHTAEHITLPHGSSPWPHNIVATPRTSTTKLVVDRSLIILNWPHAIKRFYKHKVHHLRKRLSLVDFLFVPKHRRMLIVQRKHWYILF